jgi:hypothetical protein
MGETATALLACNAPMCHARGRSLPAIVVVIAPWASRAASGGSASCQALPTPSPCLRPSADELPIVMRHVMVGQGPVASSRFVRQPLNTILHEALDPLVDKAPADPNGVGDVRDRDTIGDE